ncbi:ferredoxin [Thalassobacillus sp. C254]|uniref:(2Fe-2S) ferredoxin domain-containing protein n=1 Tax=Thalassobacillus sp. C254 TaxID=1225341 RepID=UPI0006D2871B|nr:(2Fe-2S) ferredoxin domain-containing protein [Thalassobacillus sp. C254]
MATWNLSETSHHILICNGGSCMKQGGEEVTLAIREAIKDLGIDDMVHTTRTRCNGRCEDACVVIVYPEGIWYQGISRQTGKEIITKHIQEKTILEDSLAYQYSDGGFLRQQEAPVGIYKRDIR